MPSTWRLLFCWAWAAIFALWLAVLSLMISDLVSKVDRLEGRSLEANGRITDLEQKVR